MKNLSLYFKNYRTLLLLGLIAIATVRCKTGKSVAPAGEYPRMPVKSDVAIAQSHWPEITFDTLKQGYSIYKDKCATCHDYKKPQDFGVHEWWVIMRKMGRKAQLNSEQDSLVLHYLLTKREALLGSGK